MIPVIAFGVIFAVAAFFLLLIRHEATMAKLDSISAALSNLSAKVDAHNQNDASVVAAKDAEIQSLKDQLAAGGVSDEEVAATVAVVDSIGAKL